VEETLSRAAYQLEQGKIQESLNELATITGYARVLTGDWEDQAQGRLLVDQSARALRASAVLRHASFA
jgi:hypothetical protein